MDEHTSTTVDCRDKHGEIAIDTLRKLIKKKQAVTVGLTGLQLFRLHLGGLRGERGLAAEALAVAVLVLAGLVQGLRLTRRRDRGVEVEHLTSQHNTKFIAVKQRDTGQCLSQGVELVSAVER